MASYLLFQTSDWSVAHILPFLALHFDVHLLCPMVIFSKTGARQPDLSKKQYSHPTPRWALRGKRRARAGPWRQFPRAHSREIARMSPPVCPCSPTFIVVPWFPPFSPVFLVFPWFFLKKSLWHGKYSTLLLEADTCEMQ